MTTFQPDPDASPIFIVGPSRSGTTLLRNLLNAHPRIHLTHEASFYLLHNLMVLPMGYDASEWLEGYVQLAQFRLLGIPAEELRRALPSRLPRRELPRVFRAVMRLQAQRYGGVRFGDKTPIHSGFLRQIFGDFEDPRVVHMARDPRATVASLLRMPWSSPSVGGLSLHVDEQLKAALTHGYNVHEVQLESLIEEPERILRGVFAFIGEEWDDAVLDRARHQPPDDSPPFPWFSRAQGPPRRSSGPPQWQRQLSGVWIRTIERQNRFAMQRYGYATAPLPREPTLMEYLAEYAADVPNVVRSLHRFLKVAYHFQRHKLRQPDLLMELRLNANPAAWRYYPDFTIPKLDEVATP